MFIYSNNAVKPHSYGDKDLRNKFPLVMSCRDNVKLKTALKPSFLMIEAGTSFYPITVTYCLNNYF